MWYSRPVLEPGSWVQRRYRVLTPLGAGGMGHVYLVEDALSLERCVLKQVDGEHLDLSAALEHEFALLSGIAHPRLLRVRDFGVERSSGRAVPYYTADFIEGIPLAEWARQKGDIEGPWLDALEGLSVLHGLGVRHGDVSPANVLVQRDGRGVLIDLGCARSLAEASSVVSGTPGYIAPELLDGQAADGRADLYSAGCTLRTLFSDAGRAPPPKLAKLIARLTSADPIARPTDCTEVLEALGRRPARLADHSGLARKLVGRDEEVFSFGSWLDAWLAGQALTSSFVFSGPPGVGLSRLLRECVWRAQRVVDVAWGDARQPRAVANLLERALGSELRSDSLSDLIDVLRRRSGSNEAVLLCLDDAEVLPEPELLRLLAVARLLGPEHRLALLLTCRKPERFEGLATTHSELSPLKLAAIRDWTRGALSERRLGLVHRYTGGLPASIAPTLAALHAGKLSDAELASGDFEGGTLRSGALSSHVSDAAARNTVAFFAALGGTLDTETWPLTSAQLDVLESTGLTERAQGRIALKRRADLALFRNALRPRELEDAHGRVAERLQREGRDPLVAADLVRHLALGRQVERAERVLLDETPQFAAEPRLLLEAAAPLAARTKRTDVLVALGALALAAGVPLRALTFASRAMAARPPPAERTEARLLAADCYLKLGRAPHAENVLARLLRGDITPHQEARACECRARALIQCGQYAEAQSWAERGAALGSSDVAVAAALDEAQGVARGYLGDRERAEAYFAASLTRLGGDASPRTLCRIRTHRAILQFRAGEVAAATEHYREALRVAEQHQLEDLCAVGYLNLGTSEHQAGNLGEALGAYERGLDRARALGRVSTELTLRYNLANLYAEVGAYERAEDTLAALVHASGERHAAHFAGPIALLRAELALSLGQYDVCEVELALAETHFERQQSRRELVETELRRAELCVARGLPNDALERLPKLAEAAREVAATDLVVSVALAESRARLALGEIASAAALADAQRLARSSGLRLLDVQLESELGRVRRLEGAHDLAAAHDERARRLWDRMAIGLPSTLRDVFWGHPRRRRADVTQSFEGIARDPGAEVQTLRKLLSVNRRLNSALTAPRVLDATIDAAIELTGAERGFLLLCDSERPNQGPARIAVARNEGGTLAASERPSQSIVERVISSEVPMLTTDALRDPRFAQQGSVHALRLKSVLCVPISAPTGVLGALYVDNRVERGRFSEAAREILRTLADQAAIALSNARLHDELERRTRELEQQKLAVERLSRGQARAIAQLERRLATQQTALGTRYDYSRIAGRGPGMRAVLEKLDRVTDAPIDVLVRGASGTGKELVARALHHNGPRKAGPFVALNCAALPENLLESELFGHVRGAFTGADRDKTGLMVAANGGTLFLDELGEMPLATQAKLLRVLQEREVRPVGATRVSKLDVRLVCATNRDLHEDIATGRFREDLYYRVAVVEIVLPPLRERVEDIADIARTLLERLAREQGEARGRQTEPPELTREALRLLMGHTWPGNVRELENALRRALVLSDGSRITEAELELTPRRPPGRSRSRVEFQADERERIFEALRASGWNVSHVARTLAIPRNTLYRKMQKYGIAPAGN